MSKIKGKYSSQGDKLLLAVEAYVAEILRDKLPRAGMQAGRMEALAGDIGKQVADTLRDTWGGQHVYISYDRPRRDALIFDEFTGDNHHELAEKYHMSTRNIYAIVKAEKDRRRHKQLTLL